MKRKARENNYTVVDEYRQKRQRRLKNYTRTDCNLKS